MRYAETDKKQAVNVEEAGRLVRKYSFYLSRASNRVGISVLLVMMFIIVLNVILRYFFRLPILGAYEMTQLAMVIVIFFGLAYTMNKKGHVRVDILVSRLSPRAQASVSCIGTFLSLIIFSLVTWRTVSYAITQWIRGITTAVLHITVIPFIVLAAFGIALLCLALIVQFLEDLAQVLDRSRWKVWLILASGMLLALLMVSLPFWLRELLPQSSPVTAGYIGFGFLIALLFSGMPIGFVMALVGFMGMTYVSGIGPSFDILGRVPYTTVASYDLSVIPLFILMGQFAFHAGITEELYRAAYKLIGHLPGGLAMATILACGGFSAACGSSVATASTMGIVALPEMNKYNYDKGLSAGSIAAGGTLGILIPPSVAFCVIGLMTDESIGKLFMAGILPGVLLVSFFMITVFIIARRNVRLAPAAPRANRNEMLKALKGVWGILALFLLVMGGIYMGVFTPTEAGGIGAFGALLLTLVKRNLNWKSFNASLLETGQIVAMIFIIWIGAYILDYFVTVTQMPMKLSVLISTLGMNRYVIFVFIIIMYLVLGCVMESLALTILTVPLVFPIMTNLGYDPIWLGVIIVITAEMALITPPVGMNVFIIAGIVKDVPMFTIFRGALPFLFAMLLSLVILTAFPQIALILPKLMVGS